MTSANDQLFPSGGQGRLPGERVGLAGGIGGSVMRGLQSSLTLPGERVGLAGGIGGSVMRGLQSGWNLLVD